MLDKVTHYLSYMWTTCLYMCSHKKNCLYVTHAVNRISLYLLLGFCRYVHYLFLGKGDQCSQ